VGILASVDYTGTAVFTQGICRVSSALLPAANRVPLAVRAADIKLLYVWF